MMANPLVGWVVLGGVALATDGAVVPPDPIPDPAETGILNVELTTDDADEVDPVVGQVRLTVEEVQVRHVSMGWVRLSDQARDLDLMAIRDDAPARLGGRGVHAGRYDTLRLVVADPRVLVNGKERSLRINQVVGPAPQTLDFPIPFFLATNVTRTLEVEWELDAALSEVDGQWILSTGVPVEVDLED